MSKNTDATPYFPVMQTGFQNVIYTLASVSSAPSRTQQEMRE
jgi:hypothetical protein